MELKSYKIRINSSISTHLMYLTRYLTKASFYSIENKNIVYLLFILRSRGRAVRQWSAKPSTAVQVRPRPQLKVMFFLEHGFFLST